MQEAIIMVTHDIRMVKECDAVYKMKDGVLTPKGRLALAKSEPVREILSFPLKCML